MPKKEECLVDLEQIAIAASGLLEDTIYPMFRGSRLDRLLEEISKEEGCSREAAALSWMEENFDCLYAAVYAVSALVEVLQP